jgi:hypothetical protein
MAIQILPSMERLIEEKRIVAAKQKRNTSVLTTKAQSRGLASENGTSFQRKRLGEDLLLQLKRNITRDPEETISHHIIKAGLNDDWRTREDFLLTFNMDANEFRETELLKTSLVKNEQIQ